MEDGNFTASRKLLDCCRLATPFIAAGGKRKSEEMKFKRKTVSIYVFPPVKCSKLYYSSARAVLSNFLLDELESRPQVAVALRCHGNRSNRRMLCLQTKNQSVFWFHVEKHLLIQLLFCGIKK